MRKFALLAAAALAATAAPASASVVIVDGNSYNPGDVINTIHFTGDNSPGAHADLTITFSSVDASGDYHFLYSLANTSNTTLDPNANVSAFGFNIDPNISSALVTAIVGDIDGASSGSISGGFNVEFCATAGPNCAGGANGGPKPGNTYTGTFTLLFAGTTDPGTVTLTNDIVRFQNTTPTGSDVGHPVPGVPEPATWAMMLLGFGVTGVAMRRSRRRKALLPQLA
jgi:hypothetical protein